MLYCTVARTYYSVELRIEPGQILNLPLRLVGQVAVSVAVGDRHRPVGVGQDPLEWERPIK